MAARTGLFISRYSRRLSSKRCSFFVSLSLTGQRRNKPMTRPIVLQPGALLALFLGWVTLLVGAFALGLRLA
jgi:hypothetical protein